MPRSTPNALDRTDLRILALLQGHGRATNAEIAEAVSLSASACLRRVQRLETEGVIAGYAALVDPAAVGLGLQAFVRLQLEKHGSAEVQHFVERVQSWNEVVACHALTGEMDYHLKVATRGLAGLSRFVNDVLLPHDSVQHVKTSIVLDTLKNFAGLPLDVRR